MTDYVRNKIAIYSEKINVGRTLEIGSWSNQYKSYFSDHTGIDLRQGSGVDIVMNAHDLSTSWRAGTFDTVLWLETAEHDDAFWVTRECIDHVLKPGGYLAISVPDTRFPYHGYNKDYWRFTEDGFRKLFMDYTIIDFDVNNKGNPPYGVQPKATDAYVGLAVKPLRRKET
jgi:hypothetical protein